MKVAIFIVVLCFARVYSGIVDTNKSDVDHACLREYGVDPDLILTKPESEESKLPDEQLYCIVACVYRDYGIMRPNGTIDVEKAETYFGKEDHREREIFFTVYNACKKGNVACTLAQCMFRELKNHWSSSSSSSSSNELEFSSEFNRRIFTSRELAQFA